MYSDRIYEIGKKTGLTKKDIANILSSESKKQNNISSTSPVEAYKGELTYGTISIKDFIKS